jgi:hypothetical protein
MQSNNRFYRGFILLVALMSAVISGCNKTQLESGTVQAKAESPTTVMLSSKVVNPFSLSSVQQALKELGRGGEPLDDSRIYSYYSFDPTRLKGDMLSIVEADETHHILDFPFASSGAFTDAFTANYVANSAAARDGKLYIVFKKSSNLESLFAGNAQLGATKLDELYLPNEKDQQLQLKTVANSKGMTVEAFKISWPCLFKQPRGRVTYLDTETGQTRGVPNIQVWAIAFGIPITTTADDNGFYAVPWFFSVGTVIGTHAKNARVNVKPFDVTGSVLSVIAQLTTNFIVGSVHIENAFSACQMKNDININFNQNNQKRYWAQLLDAVRLHHTFTAQDGINSAPWGLTWYAAWDNSRGGAFSAPMLSHMSTNTFPTINNAANILSLLFDTNISANAPNFFNLLTGLLPSITTDESPASMVQNGNHYSERLMEGALHELAHASLFTQVGQIYWGEVITNILAASVNNPCGGYGCGTEIFAGKTQVNEAWAEYLGKTHHRRLHPNGEAVIDVAGGGTIWSSYPAALENATFFRNIWIPTGVFFDLTDAANTAESNDNIQGITISQMYGAFSPNIHNFCGYEDRFLQMNSNVTRAQFNSVLLQNGRPNCGL